MAWYYAKNNEKQGPVKAEFIKTLYENNEITLDTLVWKEGFEEWVPLKEVIDQVNTAEFCVECNKQFPIDELVNIQGKKVCGGCKNLYMQKLREGVETRTSFEYAGFWIRVGAAFLDGIISTIVYYPVNFLVTMLLGPAINPNTMSFGASYGVMILLSFVFTYFYFIFPVAKYGATPGKLIVGLRTVTLDGNKLTIAHAIGRYFAKFLSSFTLMIGYIMVAFTDEKTGLHDKICNTRVIKKVD